MLRFQTFTNKIYGYPFFYCILTRTVIYFLHLLIFKGVGHIFTFNTKYCQAIFPMQAMLPWDFPLFTD